MRSMHDAQPTDTMGVERHRAGCRYISHCCCINMTSLKAARHCRYQLHSIFVGVDHDSLPSSRCCDENTKLQGCNDTVAAMSPDAASPAVSENVLLDV
jgi:hypothetical protein